MVHPPNTKELFPMSDVLATPGVPTTYALRAGEGEARWWFGMLATIKARADQTAGAYSFLEVVAPPHLAAPPHVHYRDDELFIVLEGSVTFYVGDQVIEASAGDIAMGPRDIPHHFVVGPDGARMHWVLSPGGFEDFVRDASVPARELTVPPADVVPPQDAAEIVLRHGMELLG
jgi:quercetin dioxygenase-like cupin family protein